MKQTDGPGSHDPAKAQMLRDQGRKWFAEASAQTRSEMMTAGRLSPEFERRSKINKELISAPLSLGTAVGLFAAGYWWTTLLGVASLLVGLWSLYCLVSLWRRRSSPSPRG